MASTSTPKRSNRALPPSPPIPFSDLNDYVRYDVFISFRGIDTRNNFTSHLYDRLITAGIHTFMDDDELNTGKDIFQQLMEAIQQSKYYIVIFSINYASSTWCLNELVLLNESKSNNGRNNRRVLIPVFYGVDPSEVRRQSGKFEEAFIKHEAMYFNRLDMVKRWRDALTEAANLSGFDLQRSALGSESRLISLIVKVVLSGVNPEKLHVANNPIGLNSRLMEVYSLLRLESNNDVCLMGIWGMGGSGKTVIAKYVYNKIHHFFHSSCFLANVREVSQQPNGLVHLQEQLISQLLMKNQVKVDNVDRGIEVIRERLRQMQVLIVLDDLDNASQLYALAGHRDWFGRKSIIIITTRDQHVLNQFEVDVIYRTRELNYEEALELFSLHSFKQKYPNEPYVEIANKFISYSCGLPLALEILGAFLFGRTIKQWNSAFEKLLQIPLSEIQRVLKISYDGLDDQEREIFLDIACFFIGMDIDYVTEILNGCNFSAEIGIQVLIDRCLITVNRNSELMMHDLLREMGREIIRQPFPKEPGKRSRLWSYKDATDVLMRNKATEAIEGVTIISPIKEETRLTAESFMRMHNLRLLQMDNVNLDGNFKHLSENIRWIRWHDCSLERLPPNLQMKNLVALDMQHSKMITIWQGIQFLRHLKILNLSHSSCLVSTPDFTSAPNIVMLIFEGCTSLFKIHPSIGCLDDLLVLDLKGCDKIINLPSEICNLRSLACLNLSGCSNLRELPDDLGCILSLRELYADETTIKELPSFSRENLMILSPREYDKFSIDAVKLMVSK